MKQVNPFDVIEEQKKVIENLTYKLNYSKNKAKDTKDINKLIHTVKCFEHMLVSKYKTDAVDKLLYALIYEILMITEAYKREIPLFDIIRTIHNAIDYDKTYKRKEIIGILKSHELVNKFENNSMFDNNFVNFEPLLDKLITELKQDMIWNT